MEKVNLILLIILGLMFVLLLAIRAVNTLTYMKLNVPEIKSADINISTSKIATLIEGFTNFLGVSDLKIEYGTSEDYCKPFKMLNRKTNQVNIPKWVMPSVGYELDYLFGSIWLNAMLYKKDKDLNKFRILMNVFPIVGRMFFYFGFIVAITLYVIYQVDFTVITTNEFLNGLYKIPVIQFFGISGFLLVVSSHMVVNNFKINLESKYERSITKFVEQECSGYKSDVVAARFYAIQFQKVSFSIFKGSKQTRYIKFLGPFVSL